MYEYDVEIGQKRKWLQSGRVFIVKSEVSGTSFLVCQYEDGSEEDHDSYIINCKSYKLEEESQ